MPAVSRPLTHGIVFALFISALSPLASAEIPQVISYQGKVTDTGGTPVADGTYTMRFRIYNAASGGTLRWDSGNRSIQVTDGVFNVLLGESPQPAINLPFAEDYWLLVTFDGVSQTPRQQLASAGYAYMASGVVLGTEVSGSVTTDTYAAIKGTNTAGSGTAYGLYGQCYSTGGSGVYGKSVASSGYTYGVQGQNASTFGSGVHGYAISTSGNAFGVSGRSASSSGRGLFGYATSETGTTYGVYGQTLSTAGRGIYGYCAATSGTTYGVYGKTISSAGIGVYGEATTTTGTTYGGYFHTSSTDGIGVYGEASNTALWEASYGGWFETASHYGIGIEAYATNTAGSGFTYAVRGTNQTSAGYGVYGAYAPSSGTGIGVGGVSWADSGAGVWGYGMGSNNMDYGVSGSSHATSGRGVYGTANHTSGQNYGVYGKTSSTAGKAVYGWADATTGLNFGGYFGTASPSGYGVWYTGGLAGTGSKSCVVRTFQGPTLFYCQESTECWFEDFGEGKLINGVSHIELDPLFVDAVTIDENNDLKVFVQLHDRNCKGVAVEKGRSGFDVVELNGGRSDGTFDYRVVAKRKGFETRRLDYCEAARTDPYLYLEYREKLSKEHRKEQARLKRDHERIEGERARQELEYNRVKERRMRLKEGQTLAQPEYQIGVEEGRTTEEE